MDRETIQQRFGITGTSSAIRHVIDQVRLVARTDVSVLIQGDSGVGKELVAKAIHALGKRKHGRLLVVNCGAIPEGLLESELFGTEKGAYTGAVERRAGFFEEADGGTIFLDEIGEMTLGAQVRLLRVLETGEFSRVGSSVVKKTDVRIIAATNKDLPREVQENRFREDLYYRLSTVVIPVPPLRQRREDILALFDQFLHEFSQQYNVPAKTLTPEARDLLLKYRWPGNVRELRNVAERVIVLHPAPDVGEAAIRPHLRGVSASGRPGGLVPVRRDDAPPTESHRERELIYRALVEMRMEVRDLRRQIEAMMGGRRRDMLPSVISKEGPDFVILKEDEPRSTNDFIEDIAFEIDDSDAVPNGDVRSDVRDDVRSDVNGHGPSETKEERRRVVDVEAEVLPTLEDAERALIGEALRRFDGNRRQTSKALGISERTLYRKIKEMETSE